MVLGKENAIYVVVFGVFRLAVDLMDCIGNVISAAVRGSDKLLGLNQTQLHQSYSTECPYSSCSTVEQVGSFCSRSFDNISIAQHHLHIVDRVVKEPVPK